MKVKFLHIGEITDKTDETVNNFTDSQKITVHQIQYMRSDERLYAIIHYDEKIS